MTAPSSLFRREIPSDKTLLSELIQQIESIRPDMGLDDTAFYNFMIAFTEAVNNAIIHGNKQDSGKRVLIEIERMENGVVCTVQDQGEGFIESDIADPINPDNLFAESGRGVFIIRALMADVNIESTPEGTRISFVCLGSSGF